jgi:hypothetical protein
MVSSSTYAHIWCRQVVSRRPTTLKPCSTSLTIHTYIHTTITHTTVLSSRTVDRECCSNVDCMKVHSRPGSRTSVRQNLFSFLGNHLLVVDMEYNMHIPSCLVFCSTILWVGKKKKRRKKWREWIIKVHDY